MRKRLLTMAFSAAIALLMAAPSYAGNNRNNSGGDSSANAGAAAGAYSSSDNSNNNLNIAGGGAGGDGGDAWAYGQGGDGGTGVGIGGDSSAKGGNAKAVGNVNVSVAGDAVVYEARRIPVTTAYSPALVGAASPKTCGISTSTTGGVQTSVLGISGGSADVVWDVVCLREQQAIQYRLEGNSAMVSMHLAKADAWIDSIDGLDNGDKPDQVASATVWNNKPLVGGRPE